MVFKCQEDSFLTEWDTKVKSCSPAKLEIVENGKKKKISGYEVILAETILFPEGGGQPDDRGTIDAVPVHRITRRAAEAVNFVENELPVGKDVHLVVDWERRFDNMQQHSGQHLITALADKMFGFKTTSWSLGDKISFIELDTPEMTPAQMATLEVSVNEKIREAVPVKVEVYDSASDPKLSEVRARGLPEDHVGAVRVICFEGIDNNMCCGTHVSNLSQLQIIKLMKIEKGKKNKTNLFYLTGNRVLKYLSRGYEAEKSLVAVFNSPLEQHAELAEKLIKTSKSSQKCIASLLHDIASLEIRHFNSQEPKEPLFVLHRKEADMDFMNFLCREMSNQEVTLFLTGGDDKGSGLFMLVGKEDLVADVGPSVAKILDGKGAGKKGRFQGKANKMANRDEAIKVIQEKLTSS
ncbi:alanyl-tRNA editing protein Aarsd1 [Octopus sinensis]|uniref:Alanyl-tRNA editing protein Aarsd1 n=1 Tax=Octopus sinensis TaxID=2607531 RepID=A0A6P7T9F0_9MOLL|nr:alanyl-tRNA editing protein Aarsd1 [Octopus sinensis]